jgi:hypothetical protein
VVPSVDSAHRIGCILAAVDRARAHIEQRLRNGEYVSWWGQPDPQVLLTSEDKFLIPLGVVFALLGGPLTLLPLFLHVDDQPAFSPVAFLFFTFVGLYIAFIRLFVKRALKRRTVYALTSMAAITASGPRDIDVADRANWELTVAPSNNGEHLTVSFGALVTPMYRWSRRRPFMPNTGFDFLDFSDRFPVAFYDVADVDGLKAALARVSAPDATKS